MYKILCYKSSPPFAWRAGDKKPLLELCFDDYDQAMRTFANEAGWSGNKDCDLFLINVGENSKLIKSHLAKSKEEVI